MSLAENFRFQRWCLSCVHLVRPRARSGDSAPGCSAEKLLTNEQDCRARGKEQRAVSIGRGSENHRAGVERSSRPRGHLESKRSPLVGPRQRRINKTLEAVPARQASFDRGLNDIWRKEVSDTVIRINRSVLPSRDASVSRVWLGSD